MSNTDPVLRRLNRVRILYIVAGALLLIGFILIFVGSTFDHGKSSVPMSSHFIEFGIMIFGFLLSFASISLVTRYYKKAQQQRIIAVQGGVPGPIAAEQPIASTASLTLPFTLRFHANWRYFVFLMILPMILAVVRCRTCWL